MTYVEKKTGQSEATRKKKEKGIEQPKFLHQILTVVLLIFFYTP